MSEIKDEFRTRYDGEIAIKCGDKTISKKDEKMEDIDFSSPQVITVSKTGDRWPMDIQAWEDGACNVAIKDQSNCKVLPMPRSECKWRVKPDEGVTDFSLTIESRTETMTPPIGNDPGTTVTIGEPPDIGTPGGKKR